MDKDRRVESEQSRRLMLQELNDAQKAATHQLERFGWSLCFVRRPLFKDVIPVLKDPDNDRYAVLEKEGALNEDHGLSIRE
jgi:hypothetical protein